MSIPFSTILLSQFNALITHFPLGADPSPNQRNMLKKQGYYKESYFSG